jgi:HYDIN/CFA65/VesB-like, Ig-like domain/Cep192 domain 4
MNGGKGLMRIRNCVLMLVVFTSAYSTGQSCQGDCQTGAIAGPYPAAQTAENTAVNFPQCVGSCGTGWNGNQLEGIDAQQNIGNQYQFYDQNYYNIDANIAVGPTVSDENAQVLEWVNGDYVQAFDKVTGQPIFTIAGGTEGVPVTVDGLWSSSTQPECQNSTGNVQVIYDRLDNVFVISRRITYLESGIDHYSWCIALSSSSDLSNTTTIWHAYEFKMDTAIPCLPSSNGCTTGTSYYYYPDWPRIGTWSNGFYITFDLLDPTAGRPGFEACQLDRADMVLGQSANPMTCYTYMIPQNEEPSLIHSVDVGDIDSATGPPNGEPEYFLSMVSPSNLQQGNNGQGVCTSQSTPCTSNQLALFTWGTNGFAGPTFVTVNPYTPGCYDTSKPGSEINTICVPVPSTNPSQIGAYGSLLCGDYVPGSPCLDSLGDRMANRLTYNNLTSSGSGPNGAYLTGSHIVMESASNERTGIRYYSLQVSNGTATVLVNSGGTSGPPDLQDPNGTLFYFMPSAALDKNGNLAIEYTTSGAHCSSCQTQYNPAISVDVLPWGTSNFEAPTMIVQGTGDQENTPHWGEYAATVIDSTDDLTFYGMGEYFNTSQTGTSNCQVPASNCHTWQTRIFRQALPAVSLAPLNLTFAPQTINTTSSPQITTLTNTGAATLTFSSIEITGLNATDFGETNTCGPTLAPSNSCQVSVTFTPTAAGGRSAALSITDDAPRSPQTVGLAGTGTTAVATLSPLNITFAGQYVKNSGPPQTVTLTNTGTATLAITNVAASPADFGMVSTSTPCGSSLAAGSSCSIGVFFDPTAMGTRTGTLSVTDNAAGSPQTVTLTGMGQDFAVAPSGSATATVAAGQTANYTVAIAPGGGFDQTVVLSCSGAPPQSACSLSSSSVALHGSAPASVTVAVRTAGTMASLAHPAGSTPDCGRLALWLTLSGWSGLVLGSCARSRKRHNRLLYGVAFLCLISLGITFSSCGGGTSSTGNSASATPPGSYDLTVTGTFTSASTTLTHAAKLTLVVQ